MALNTRGIENFLSIFVDSTETFNLWGDVMAYRSEVRHVSRTPTRATILFAAYLVVVAVVLGLMAVLRISPFDLPSIPAGFRSLI